MKKLVVTLAAFSFIFAAHAQKGFYYGGLLGIGQSSFRNSSIDNQSNMLLLSGGVTASYHFNSYVGLSVNGLVTSKGTKATGTVPATLFNPAEDYEIKYNLLYAEIPLLVKLRYGKDGFYGKLFGGPSFNFNLNGTYDIDYKNSTNKDMTGQKINNLNVMETSLLYGAGIEVHTDNAGLYSLEFRINEGMSSIAKSNNNNDIYTRYFAICLGWNMD